MADNRIEHTGNEIIPYSDIAALHLLVMEWKLRHYKGSITLHFPGSGMIAGFEQKRSQTPDDVVRNHKEESPDQAEQHKT